MTSKSVRVLTLACSPDFATGSEHAVNGPCKDGTALEESTEDRRKGNRIDVKVDDIHEVVLIRY